MPRPKGSAPADSLVADLFGFDLRSLAAFRVGIALVVLGDILTRAGDLTAFYTDSGVLPRTELLGAFAWLHEWPLCVHLLGGSWWSQALIFAVHAFCAVCLLIGYRTRVATVAVWLLTSSLQLRNLYIGHGSDAQLRMMLFWACFLPLGARYSVDSALRWSAPPRERQQYLSVGTVALIAQIVIIYLSTGYAKLQYPWWRDGTAVAYVFDNEIWGTYTGHFLLQFPALCALFTYGTLLLELAGPLLLFLPVFFGPVRTATIAALIGLHIGFGVGMRVGIFPFTSIAALLSLLPRWFWEQLLAWLRTPERTGVSIAFHEECRRCSTILVLLRTFFLLPETAIGSTGQRAPSPGQASSTSPQKGAASSAPVSAEWTVTDHTGQRHRDLDALLWLSRVSPLLWPLGALLSRPPMRRWAEILWRRFAAHAPAAPPLLARLQPRPPVRRNRIAETVCALLLAFVVFWNIGVARDSAFAAPAAINWLGSSFFLQQDWRMYSRVATRTGFVVMPAKLKNGTELDLFQLGGPLPDLGPHPDGPGVSYERPEPPIYRVKNYRWLGMMDRLLHFKRGEQQLQLYGRYMCREWNAAHAGDEQLESFEIVFMAREVIPLQRTHATPEYDREVLWRHWCFGGPPSSPGLT